MVTVSMEDSSLFDIVFNIYLFITNSLAFLVYHVLFFILFFFVKISVLMLVDGI